MNDDLSVANILVETPGQMIKDARVAKQISVAEVVQKLLLSKQIVAALEDDDYSKISAPVYAEGYLRAYAQFLQIPVDIILKSFRKLDVYRAEPKKVYTKSNFNNHLQLLNLLKTFQKHFMLLIVLVAIIFIIFMVRSFSSKELAPPNSATTVSNGVSNLPIKQQIPEKEQVSSVVVPVNITELPANAPKAKD